MPGQRKPEYANDFNKADALEVLLALQGKVNRELHVANLCVIESKQQEHMYRCSCFPKMKDRDAAIIYAICIRQSDEAMIDNALAAASSDSGKKPIAITIMTDLDSSANYSSIKSKQKFEAAESASQLHSLNNAVIAYIGDTVDGTAIESYIPSDE